MRIRMRRVRFSLFPVLLGVAYVLIEGSFAPLWILLFSLLHELGHIAAVCLLGGGIRGFSGGGQGFGLAVNGLSYGGEIVAALAGPLVNLILAAAFGLSAWLRDGGAWFFCYANVGLAAVNLLPIMPLDGGRVLRAALALLCPLPVQRRISQAVGLIFLLPLLALSFLQFLSSGYNISLLLISLYLILLIKENGNDV